MAQTAASGDSERDRPASDAHWPRRVLILLFVWVWLVPAGRAGARTISVGIYQNEPKVFTNRSGAPSGIFVDLLEHIAKAEGWQLRYVEGTWVEGLTRLASGEIDLMPDVAYTAEREQVFSFHHEPVLSSWSQVYARPGSGIKSILDLSGKRVAVLDKSVQQRAFEQLAASFDLKVTIVPLHDFSKVFQAVVDGEVDAAIANNFYGAMHLRRYGLDDTAVVFHPSSLYFAVPRGTRKDLLEALDKHLRKMKGEVDSPYYRSVKRWISEEVRFKIPTWMHNLGLVAGAVLVMSLTGSLVLNRQVQARTLELKQSNEQLVIIDRLLRTTATQLDLQVIMDNAVKGIRDLTGLAGGILCLAKRHSDELHPRVTVDLPEGVAASLRETPLRFGECLIGRAAQGQEPLVIEDNASSSPFAERCPIREAGIRFFAGFPLRAGEESVGVLCVFSYLPVKIDPGRLNLVRDVCGPLSLALENARLYKQEKLHTEELERRVQERTAELQVAMERALAADRIKSAFLATMSHELRTPLNSIIGFTGILLQGLAGPLNEEQQKQLGMVQGSSRHLLALINDVLDISKIEAGQLRLSVSSFEPQASIAKVASVVAPLAGKKSLDLRLEVAPDLPSMTGDQGRFEQVLLNLVNNAVKYTDHGQVLIRASRADDRTIQVAVSDTGIGIKEEDLPRLFQPFFQVDMGVARKYEGTGLGLSITRKLLDLMGGTIAVRSEVGRGSTFTVSIPRTPGGLT